MARPLAILGNLDVTLYLSIGYMSNWSTAMRRGSFIGGCRFGALAWRTLLFCGAMYAAILIRDRVVSRWRTDSNPEIVASHLGGRPGVTTKADRFDRIPAFGAPERVAARPGARDSIYDQRCRYPDAAVRGAVLPGVPDRE